MASRAIATRFALALNDFSESSGVITLLTQDHTHPTASHKSFLPRKFEVCLLGACSRHHESMTALLRTRFPIVVVLEAST
jgi:hypothetical protein